jgi:hypothetical protein
VSDRYSEVAQRLRVDVAAAVRRAQRRHLMRLAARYTAVVILTAGSATAGVLARTYVQSLASPWQQLLILLLWLTIAAAIYLIASLRRSATRSPLAGLERGRVGQNIGRLLVRLTREPAPTWVTVLAVTTVLIAVGALAYDNWPVATEWRVSSDPLVRLSVGAGALLAAALARAAFRRWQPSREQRSRRRPAELPDDIRAEPHTRPVEVTVETEHDSPQTFVVRLEPHPDPGLPARAGGDRMTAAQPLTASAFVFGSQDTGGALALALDEHGVRGSLDTALGQVAQTTRKAASDQVAAVADGLLALDLGDLVIAGLRKQSQLVAAAERTAANPGSSEVVELANHRIGSVHRSSVELLVNDVHVATVNFELALEFEVKALVATVRDGHLVSLHSADCDLTATLTAEGVRLASRRRQFSLPVIVRWPLQLHLGGGTDPLPYGAQPPQASSPSPSPSPSRRRRSLINPPLRWQRRDKRDRPGPPAD